MAPSQYNFIISIGPVDMNQYARFDEIPSMTLKDIKETKRYGRMDGRSNETVFMWLRFRILDTYVAICLCVA